MGEQSEKIKKNICMGLLAHVDAGKTTLSEALLYLSGKIRKLGRVDHKDAYLDTSPLERERGITIFSKQAVLEFPETRVTILDTPGHVDFSAEMERTLQVLDYAVLLINGADGVQGHTVTLWKLLERYQIPTFIFVNKMDQDGTDHDALLTELKKRLNENCMDFSENADGALEPELPAGEKEQQNLIENKFSEEFLESLAMCDEKLLEKYLETGEVSRREIIGLIADRKVFPCYFGSALRMEGVEKLTGAPVRASDLRAGAALIVAGLMADGVTEIYNIQYIDRGYDHIENKLIALGADIQRVPVEEEENIELEEFI